MGHFKSKLFQLVTSHPIYSFVLSLLFILPFALHLPKVETVNHVDYFTVDDEITLFYQQFKNIFGNDEFFIIAFEPKQLFSLESLKVIGEITAKLEELPEVREVTSLANIDDLIGSENSFEVRKFLEQPPSSRAELEKRKERALSKKLYVDNVISRDGKSAGIVVFPHQDESDKNFRKRLLLAVKKILRHYQIDYHLAGWTVTNYYLSQVLRRDLWIFLPVSTVLMALVVFGLFRKWRLVLLALTNMAACCACTLGFFGLSNVTFNNLTCVVLPLAMTLSLADAIHIFSHLDLNKIRAGWSKQQALANTLEQVVTPCFLTSLTTGIGFLSLALSSMPAVRDFAYMASAAMLFEFIFSFFLLPPLLLLCKAEGVFLDLKDKRSFTLDRLLIWIWQQIKSHNGLIIGSAGLALILSALLLFTVAVETNLSNYFKSDSSLRKSLNFVEQRLGGTVTFDLSLKSEKIDAFKQPENLALITEITQYLTQQHGLLTISFPDFIQEMNQAFHSEDYKYYRIPESSDQIEQYLLLYDIDDILDFVSSDFSQARIAVRAKEHSSRKQAKLLQEIKNFVSQRRFKESGLEIVLTGRSVDFVNVAGHMIEDQVNSFGTAVLVIGVVMMLVLRSFAIGLFSLIPNLFPVLLNFGFMGAFGIPLDTGTVMIASVALGIACDDTIHFLSCYIANRRSGMTIAAATEQAVYVKGRAIIGSSLVLTLGFAVLILGSFVPVVHFGILSAVVMITALFGDLLLMPAVLYRYSQFANSDLPLV